MCLTIDDIKHPDFKPIRLDKDLVVSKLLLSPDLKKISWPRERWWLKFICNFITPCRYKPIHFLFGNCILQAKLDTPIPSSVYSYMLINKGIHAYTFKNVTMYPAIIPKGTLVYYGCNNHIVAEKLIIYKDKKLWQQLK